MQEDGKVKGAEFASAAMMMPSTEAIVEENAHNINAIGYVGLGYLKPAIKALVIKANVDSTAVPPSVSTVLSKTYGSRPPAILLYRG